MSKSPITDPTHFTISEHYKNYNSYQIIGYHPIFATDIRAKVTEESITIFRADIDDQRTMTPRKNCNGYHFHVKADPFDDIVIKKKKHNFEVIDEDTLIYYF
jgi:hypothetical protein